PYIAWIKYPQVSNTQDAVPWRDDHGIQTRLVEDSRDLENAAAIVLPGSKNTLLDLEWMRRNGFDEAIRRKAKNGTPILGICGGYQMLGSTLSDPGVSKNAKGLDLLPICTRFQSSKQVLRRRCRYGSERWETFEIHAGESELTGKAENTSHLLTVEADSEEPIAEGLRKDRVWGSYQHGLFESPAFRRDFIEQAGLSSNVVVDPRSYRDKLEERYAAMADLLERCLDLGPVKRYLGQNTRKKQF
ncbi:MAG: cobyric acid synthase, partial [Symploca sp. SIO2E6]|nr:cobyric acid synthase [Symploca sp. SIO2E6]